MCSKTSKNKKESNSEHNILWSYDFNWVSSGFICDFPVSESGIWSLSSERLDSSMPKFWLIGISLLKDLSFCVMNVIRIYVWPLMQWIHFVLIIGKEAKTFINILLSKCGLEYLSI